LYHWLFLFYAYYSAKELPQMVLRALKKGGELGFRRRAFPCMIRSKVKSKKSKNAVDGGFLFWFLTFDF
jgi:hypothetical protein